EVLISLQKQQDELTDISVKEESTGTYSLEYLNPIVKAVGTASGSIICEYSSAKPLRIEFKVANMGRIHFYLAPRVES
ncbi:MAG: DNA polymerase sliding clamp, partial [Candidatus Nitrosotenuis sp.]